MYIGIFGGKEEMFGLRADLLCQPKRVSFL